MICRLGTKRIWQTTAAVVIGAGVLCGCETQGQNRYSYADVGRASLVEFGTIITSRQVDIKGQNTGTGAVIGGTAGGLAMSGVGSGNGNAAAVLGGVLVGAVAGAIAEQSMADRIGVEYTITLANGKTITLVQEQQKGDHMFASGERVMVQANGTYQRVLPADNLPTEIARPKEIKVKD
jgi:outer membrane lipoprotein SlyB